MWEGTYSFYYVVRGIELTWSDGSSGSAGTREGTLKSYEFNKGEKINTMRIQAAEYVDNIFFTTDQGGNFEAGGTGGDKSWANVGNGQLAGFDGRGEGCIDNISGHFEA